jgi:hypothetical protein
LIGAGLAIFKAVAVADSPNEAYLLAEATRS